MSLAALQAALAGLALLVVAGGCWGGKNRPATHAATGTVLRGGQPVAQAEVVFLPKEAGEHAFPARGMTDAAGRFSLRTYFSPADDASGAVAGEYRVTVTKTPVAAQVIGTEQFVPPKNELPARYATASETPLAATIAAGGSHQIALEIEGE